MKKFENVYQDAALMRKVLLGEADEVEQKDLEKRLAECPDLRNVYEQLQSGETLKVAFGAVSYTHLRAHETGRRISKIFVKESLSVFSSEYRADGIERPEESFSSGGVVRCCGCRYFSRCSFFLYVELYLIGKRRENFDSAGNAAGTIDFVRWQRD